LADAEFAARRPIYRVSTFQPRRNFFVFDQGDVFEHQPDDPLSIPVCRARAGVGYSSEHAESLFLTGEHQSIVVNIENIKVETIDSGKTGHFRGR
jgi:hypothetical protein